MENVKDAKYPVQEEGATVKDFETKIKNIGRPTVFVGSSMESKPIAEKIRASFPPDDFEVNIWYDGVFGKTRSSGGDMSNAEWLKNFTDIYDYAIFIFVPDDAIVSKTRFDMPDGKARNASGTRHNVVFEFGLFMGRIGAKKSFILFDDQAEDFVNRFFTDLNENLNDIATVPADKFRVELHKYNGNYAKYIESNREELPYDEASIGIALGEIKSRIKENFDQVDIGFLPSTSLAIGYFNNFIDIFAKIVYTLKNNLPYPKDWDQKGLNKEEFEAIADKIKKAKSVKFKIVIPDTLEGAKQSNFIADFPNEKFKTVAFPGANRPLTLKILNTAVSSEGNADIVFYDVPTTMNSSLEAIEMITEHDQIRKLLKEKERRNFRKAIEHKMLKAKKLPETVDIDNVVKIISRDEFLAETNQA